jgi:A/G-specific adenine glycosylase
MQAGDIGAALLAWYDRHARDLPWRVGPAAQAAGLRPDPYRVWLSEVMLQQTTVAAVTGYFARFTARWPGLADLAAAPEAEVMAAWAGLGYYARARNLIACARAVMTDHGGVFPDTAAALRDLPGIGPYTAAAIAAIAFDRAETVVDGNVERVMARLFAVTVPLPAAKPALRAHAASLTPRHRPGDHAQALMDLGATICTPRAPACGACPLARFCQGRARGVAAELPRRAPKPARPTRHGTAFVGRRADGAWLLERRPPHGLLGGMPGWPGCDWQGGAADPPAPGDWRDAGAGVRHTFTHFHLRLRVMVAELPAGTRPSRGAFVPARDFRPDALPTAMRKAWAVAQGRFAAPAPD